MEHHAGIVCQTVSPQPQRQLLATDALRQEGFAPDQALLPDDLRNFDGYRLLQEYFAFPARFRFISLSGLSKLIQRCENEKAFDIFIMLDKSDEQLERVVDASHLALHCTPVINLFPKVAARQKLNESQHEYHLVVDNIRPLDYEIYAVNKILAAPTASATTRRFVHSGVPERRRGQLRGLFFLAPGTARALRTRPALRHPYRLYRLGGLCLAGG